MVDERRVYFPVSTPMHPGRAADHRAGARITPHPTGDLDYRGTGAASSVAALAAAAAFRQEPAVDGAARPQFVARALLDRGPHDNRAFDRCRRGPPPSPGQGSTRPDSRCTAAP